MHIEKEATDELLQRGVRVRARAPLFLRMLGKKTVVIHVRLGTFGALLRMSSWYLKAGIRSDALDDLSAEQAMHLLSTRGEYISKAVAAALLQSKWRTWLLLKPYAAWLRESLSAKDLLAVMQLYVLQGGLDHFTSTTRLVRDKRISAPNLGQKAKRS